MNRRGIKLVAMFAGLLTALIALFVYAAITGSIRITAVDLIAGLFSGTDERVDVIRDLRFPRIIMSMLVGAVLAVSGALLQAVMRNPLADAGIIGISAGAGVFTMVLAGLLPMLFFWTPLFAFIGGAIACLLVYTFAWQGGLSPLRMVLVGIAVHMIFTGIGQLIPAFVRSSIGEANLISSSTFSFTTWGDVRLLLIYGTIGLVLAYILFPWCDMLLLQDKTAQNLGLHVARARIVLSAVAVLLASSAAAVGGFLFFVGLLVPAIARICVGSEHRVSLPFSALAGALLVLAADTLGRTVAHPVEIPASVIMMIIGGPFLLILLKRGGRMYGN
jgi:iron complex transport system permease protein